MTIATILPTPRTVFLDANSNPLSGGFVFTYVPPNTTTYKTTYQDSGAAIPNTNPIVLDGNGSCLLYGTGTYLLFVYDSNNNLVYSGQTQDTYGLVATTNNTFTGDNTFTGANDFTTASIIVPTQVQHDDSNNAASTEYVDAAVSEIVIPTQSFTGAPITGFLPTSIMGNSTTAAITVTAGSAGDSAGAAAIAGGPYSWAVANGNAINGYQGGSTLPNSSTIHFFACSGTSGTGIFSNNSTTVSPPSGYNSSMRRVFSLRTNGSGTLLPGTAVEVDGGALIFYYATQLLDISVSNQGTSQVLYLLTVPTVIKVQPLYRVNQPATNGTSLITSGDEVDVAPTASGGTEFTSAPGNDFGQVSGTGSDSNARDGIITTNASGQIGIRSTTTSVNLAWVTRGFKDFRRN